MDCNSIEPEQMSQSLTCATQLHSVRCMKINLLLLAAALLFIPFASHAVRVPGLYEAEVPVVGQQANTRVQAITLAMKTVLIKLTGDRNAPSRANLAPIITSAQKYMQQYRYVEVTPTSTDPLAAEFQLRMRISFDESSLNDTLRQAGVQLWGRERPSILIWLATEKDQARKLMIPEEEQDYFRVVDQLAEARGIVLMHPLYDLQDTSSLQASDIRAGFQDIVTNASRRYSPDTVLTGWIESPLDGIWEARWTAYLGDEVQSWTSEGSFAESVLDEGIQGMADLLATRYGSQAGTATGNTTMKVLDVNTVEHYAKVLGYLQSLSPVSRVEVIEVNTGVIEFQLTAHGGEQAVLQAINFGRILEPVSANTNLYRLLP
jgi:hypothetical protein